MKKYKSKCPKESQSDSTLSVLLNKPQRQWSVGQKLLYSHELGLLINFCNKCLLSIYFFLLSILVSAFNCGATSLLFIFLETLKQVFKNHIALLEIIINFTQCTFSLLPHSVLGKKVLNIKQVNVCPS